MQPSVALVRRFERLHWVTYDVILSTVYTAAMLEVYIVAAA